MVLLDTDVMIDILREHPPAIHWSSQIEDIIALPGFVALELIQGCNNKIEQQKIEPILKNIQILWLSVFGCDTALNLFMQYHLSHNIGLLDALIAQTALENGIPLHTFNLKHYQFIPNLITVQPYQK